MTDLIFAGNWKMHHGPTAARALIDAFLSSYEPYDDREVWFFPPAVSLTEVTRAIRGQTGLRSGAQNVYWEEKGAFTGESSVSMVRDAGAHVALVGHSERRHVFGETDTQTAKKVAAVLEGGLRPVLCVGELLEEREAGHTEAVVLRQLAAALAGVTGNSWGRIVVAYEPVWAIGTGKHATPADAAAVHHTIRDWCAQQGAPSRMPILYGGSVKPANVEELVAEEEIDGVLVGGASIDVESWRAITKVGLD
jgi:triosephosphate isomerase